MLRVNPARVFKKLANTRRLSTLTQASDKDDEWVEVAEYPKIKDCSFDKHRHWKNLSWYEKIKKIETIEEKLIEINMPRYYGFKCLLLGSQFPYNTLPFIQYATNTELEIGEFHSSADPEEAKRVDNFLGLIKSEIADALEFELDGHLKFFDTKSTDLTPQDMGRIRASGLVKQLNRVLVNTLGADHRHLYEVDTDVDPRHEAFWMCGGLNPPDRVRKSRENFKLMNPYADEPINRAMQYAGKPFLALRHLHPLKPFEEIDFDSITAKNENIPQVTHDPQTLGFVTEHLHGTSVPGFWPGNVREYGLMSYQEKNAAFRKKPPHASDAQNVIHSQGILSSYGWLLGQACYQGFSTYNDMNYPLATQTAVTDGQNFTFFKYQLNTTCMHTAIEEPNYRYNKCWGTNEMKLYENIDDKGKLQGLNDDVLRTLIKFYTNEPAQREHEMKPFLGKKEKKIADIEDVKRRAWLEHTFKHMISNRPRHRPVPEIYSWEKIYKIDNDTKPMVKKRRFFELGINPFKRQLDEHWPQFIPRHLRARGQWDKKRFDATYYPMNHRMNIPKETSHALMGAPKDPHARMMDKKRKSYK